MEVVFNLITLAHGEQELRKMKAWFDSTARALRSRPAANHSGKKASWYRAGFSFDGAMQFFELLQPQLGAMTLDRDRWPETSPVDPVALPIVVRESLPPPTSKGSAAEDSTTSDLGAGNMDPTEPPARPGWDETITFMLSHAQKASDESGQERTAVRKTKDLRFADDEVFRGHVSALLEQQQRRCSITGLELQPLGQHDDPERIASLDRIDSDGHYESGNLQIVCRFVNRWKGDDRDQEFRRLMDLLKQTWRA